MGRARGFTMVEMLIVIVMAGIILAAGVGPLRNFVRQQQADRATNAILWEITVARSYAIRSGLPVALKIDEANKKMIVRDAVKTWRTLDLGQGSELPVDSLTLNVAGDSLLFSFRGFCLNCSNVAAATLAIKSHGKRGVVQVGFLGRAERIRQSVADTMHY